MCCAGASDPIPARVVRYLCPSAVAHCKTGYQLPFEAFPREALDRHTAAVPPCKGAAFSGEQQWFSKLTFPGLQQRSRGVAGIKAAARATLWSRALTPASQPRLIIHLSGECQSMFVS